MTHDRQREADHVRAGRRYGDRRRAGPIDGRGRKRLVGGPAFVGLEATVGHRLDLDIGRKEALPGHLVPDEPDGILGGVAIEKPAPELDFVAERLEAAV